MRQKQPPATPPRNATKVQTLQGGLAVRTRIADQVFEALLRAILRGELEPDEPLPTQRELSMTYGVSPLVVRQAIHRLEELELVRVRQGSTTVVLDPAKATDVRLIQLQLEVAQPGDALSLAALENRALAPLSMLLLAERRITKSEISQLEQLVATFHDSMTLEERLAFMAQFWEVIAIATHNPVIQHQVRWWFRVSRAHNATQQRTTMTRAFLEDLVSGLRKRKGALALWIEKAQLVCQWTEAQRGHAMIAGRRRGSAKERPAR